MPKYQIKTKVNSQTINTDMEADSRDDVIVLYNAVSVGEVLEVKEYLYSNSDKDVPVDDGDYRYANVKVYFDYRLPITIKIPKLKINKGYDDIYNIIHSIYRNVQKIDIKIQSKK